MTTAQQQPVTVALVPSSNGQVLQLGGAWVLDNYLQLNALVEQFQQSAQAAETVDVANISALDTAGAEALHRLLGYEKALWLAQNSPLLTVPQRTLLQAVVQSQKPQEGRAQAIDKTQNKVVEALEYIGDNTLQVWRNIVALLAFSGLVITTGLRQLLRPKSWRVTSFFANVQQTSLNAVPIVVLMNFLVGAVVAFLGASMLSMFGATMYTINLMGLSCMREFGPLMSAILVAGRTASSFAAQIGSMRANEEVDAIRVLGLNPIEILVIPRVCALVVGLPMLAFLAMMAGLFGGMVVCATRLDISMLQFASVLSDAIGIRHFFIGLCKAPFFAFVIAVIGCLEGFKVQGSAQSVGEHTTSAVVQSIFVVILIDAAVALFCMEMGW